MAQVLAHLPGNCEALSSNPVSPKKPKILIKVSFNHKKDVVKYEW
jgi:hypothetical protein